MIKYYVEALKKYATFSGRARRKEFWYFGLMNFIIATILGLLLFLSIGNSLMEIINGQGDIPVLGIIVAIIYSLYSLAILIPGLAVGVRRLHDVGKSGWFLLIPYGGILLQIIPLIGTLASLGLNIWFIVLMCKDSQVGENKYGADPKAEERMA